MKQRIIIILFFIGVQLSAQIRINGSVVNTKNVPISGANIYLKGTCDGGTSNNNGDFSFKTTEKGTQTLVVSYMSYETYIMLCDVSYMKDLVVKLLDDVNTLDAVVLSAGTFSAGDNSKVNIGLMIGEVKWDLVMHLHQVERILIQTSLVFLMKKQNHIIV
jgi:hypothetical protein